MSDNTKPGALVGLEKELTELEQYYAESFVSDPDPVLLDYIWKRIQELRLEINKRK